MPLLSTEHVVTTPALQVAQGQLGILKLGDMLFSKKFLVALSKILDPGPNSEKTQAFQIVLISIKAPH